MHGSIYLTENHELVLRKWMSELIDSQNDLLALAPLLTQLEQQGGVVGVDTEFLREKTYRAQLCLLQLAINDHQYCIDVLALDDLDLLKRLLTAPKVLKIFHAARQDLEVILQTLGVLSSPIFDTQLAAAFCGGDLQQGYSAMVAQRLGIELPKSQARTDWSKRPLSNEQIEYARLDVKYLAQLKQGIEENLNRLVRADWYAQEIQSYADPMVFSDAAELAWQRVAGGHLKLKQQYILKALTIWRETLAQQKNIPRTWVLRDDRLFELAQREPRTVQDIVDAKIFGRRSVHSMAPDALALIQSVDVGATPIWEGSEPFSKPQKQVCSAAMKKLADFAQELEIAQALLATRKDVEYLFRHGKSKRLLSGWRKSVVGEPLLDFFQSQAPE